MDVIEIAPIVDGEGGSGTNGWSPLFAVVEDGERRVLQLTDWTDGTGTKPEGVGKYLGPDGLVDDISEATNIRGAAGSGGGGGSVAWTDITGKPTTFAPTAHTHPISQVTDLQDSLNGLFAAVAGKIDKGGAVLSDISTSGLEGAFVLGRSSSTGNVAAIILASGANASTVPYRGAGGVLKVGEPADDGDAATKKYVDGTKPRYEVLSDLPADLSEYPDGSRIIVADE